MKASVEAGQVWVDNDTRGAKEPRRFVVVSVDADYYPSGRASCEILSHVAHGRRKQFYARLDRFDGTQRGYSLESGAGDKEHKSRPRRGGGGS